MSIDSQDFPKSPDATARQPRGTRCASRISGLRPFQHANTAHTRKYSGGRPDPSTKVSGRQAKATLRGGLQSPCMRIMPACASFSHGGWEMRCDGCAHDSVQGESRGHPAGSSPWETMCQEQLRDAGSLIIC